MAKRRWETVEYSWKSGIYKFKWWYDNADSIDTVTAFIDLVFNNFKPIKIPLDVLPGESYRFSSTEIQFNYNSTIESMIDDVVLNGKTTKLFFDVIRNDVLIWRGLVDFASLKRTDFRITEASFSYKKLSMKINDALWYFKLNELTLSYGTMADDYKLKFSDFFTTICDEIGLTFSTSIEDYEALSFLDKDFFECGVIQPNLDTNIVTFIKEIMLAFGVYIFFFNGKLRIMSRIDANRILSATNTKYLSIAQEDDQNEDIGVLKITYSIDILLPGLDYPGMMVKTSVKDEDNTPDYKTIEYKISDEFGRFGEFASSEEEVASGDLGSSGISMVILENYVSEDWRIVPDPDVNDGNNGEFTLITVNNDGIDDFTTIAEPGHTIDIYNSASGLEASGLIVEVISATQLKFIYESNDIVDPVTWKIKKNYQKRGNYYRNRSMELIQHIHDRYLEYIGNPVYRFTVNGLILDPYLFIFMEKNYKVRYFSLDLVKNRTTLKAHELGSDFGDHDLNDHDSNDYL